MNDWHFVQLVASGSGFKWTNKAGVSWTLTLQGGQDLHSSTILLDVGSDCPYFKQGYTVAKLIRKENETILLGPGNEEYRLEGDLKKNPYKTGALDQNE
jgi:hypothetical protein